MASINDFASTYMCQSLPFGGVKESGFDWLLEQEFTPESGQMNPFLHLSLHLAIADQIGIDQPPGIRAAYHALRTRLEVHQAEHAILECLGETLWRAQREGGTLDAAQYLECVRRAAGS